MLMLKKVEGIERGVGSRDAHERWKPPPAVGPPDIRPRFGRGVVIPPFVQQRAEWIIAELDCRQGDGWPDKRPRSRRAQSSRYANHDWIRAMGKRHAPYRPRVLFD
jgi:hypothetical protein